MTAVGLALVGLWGLAIGSFLNVCIGRLPAGESIVSPGSRCPSCKVAIRWFDNIPVASWLLLGGRCRSCGAPISVRYLLIEVTTAIAFVAQAVVIGDNLPLLGVRLLFTAMLVTLFGTDLETQRLPNVITLPGIVVGVVFSLFLPPGIQASLIGVVLGGGLLLAVRWGWKALTGTDGMGLGDVKMLAMIGAFLGWQQIFVVLFLSSITGAIGGLAIAWFGGKSMQHRIPFGTFLAVAAYGASLFGERLVEWYLGFYR